MTSRKLLTTAFLATALVAGGVMIAGAQETMNKPDSQPKSEHRADFRHGDRGHGRGGHGGHHRGGPEMFRTLFMQVDADGDGSVTQVEIDTFRAAKVGEADTSGDGALSIEEFDTLYREFTRSRMVDAFQDLDADGDGVISAAEMDSRFGDIVERMDRDDDGALTLKRGRRG
ncbi:hypothetical protein QO034_16030 [Sedimentitalea sp. JM2-8]|uniref:EF-hand domain-containing protein n=1 Tax=Sedimentitalea xiamensis TaxID=3050037 RepID=A0ABT7FHJ6_9RHOB|nr:hypothetical protein [Sedimentitalea xiamensis]MDK3074602.1 hypothetical protein [Sedimentitalea xiamensis]